MSGVDLRPIKISDMEKILRCTGAQPLNHRVLVPESLKESERELDRAEWLLTALSVCHPSNSATVLCVMLFSSLCRRIDGGELHLKSSRESPSGPSAGLLFLRYVVMLPVSPFSIAAVSVVSATFEQPNQSGCVVTAQPPIRRVWLLRRAVQSEQVR